MQALVDADILAYEIGSIAQYVDEETGDIVPRPWDWVVETIDAKIRDICNAVGATEKPILYLTGDPTLVAMKRRVRSSLPIYEPNFRLAMAVSRDYKEGRKIDKPLHYNNIRAYFLVEYNAFVAIGCEADDEMAIEQTTRNNNPQLCPSIICTRDKDLRQVPGLHYGWESGKQSEFGPVSYDRLGIIRLDSRESPSKPGTFYHKIVGGGFKFFCSQLFTGDPVDTVPGLRGYGPVKVAGLLDSCTSTKELLDIVRTEYKSAHGEAWQTHLREQANLLWMIRERDAEGKLVFFNPKDYV